MCGCNQALSAIHACALRTERSDCESVAAGKPRLSTTANRERRLGNSETGWGRAWRLNRFQYRRAQWTYRCDALAHRDGTAIGHFRNTAVKISLPPAMTARFLDAKWAEIRRVAYPNAWLGTGTLAGCTWPTPRATLDHADADCKRRLPATILNLARSWKRLTAPLRVNDTASTGFIAYRIEDPGSPRSSGQDVRRYQYSCLSLRSRWNIRPKASIP